MGGSSGGSGPTLQQQQLQTEQALTTANLNLEENAQRKAILNAMQGTRVFRESALSRALAGNSPGKEPTGAASTAQTSGSLIAPPSSSLLDQVGSGATPSGGTGASGDNGGGIAAIGQAAAAAARGAGANTGTARTVTR